MKKIIIFFIGILFIKASSANWKEKGYWGYIDNQRQEYVCCLYQQMTKRQCQNPDQGVISISRYDVNNGWSAEQYVAVVLPLDKYTGFGQRAFDLELANKWSALKKHDSLERAVQEFVRCNEGQ